MEVIAIKWMPKGDAEDAEVERAIDARQGDKKSEKERHRKEKPFGEKRKKPEALVAMQERRGLTRPRWHQTRNLI